MAIYLIVGQPRHGKSQFAAKMAYEYEQNNIRVRKKIESGKPLDPEKDLLRNVYSDINGHAENCNFVQKAPDDWREVPEDSVIFYDEIHLRPEFCDSNGKMSQNPMIVELTTHAHKNKDIILITQDPARLNKGIHKLVEKMYLVKRPIQKPPFATIYEFERWLRDPWQAAASSRSVNYQDSYKFFYKQKWQDMYKSASAHTSVQFKIQSKFIYAIIAIIVLMTLSYLLFTKSGGDKLARNAINGISGQKAEVSTSDKNKTMPTTESIKNLDVDCRKGINVEKPECVQWFNDLSKNNGSINPENRMQAVLYNPNKPFDDEIQNNLTYEVTAKPVFSGCMKKNGRYVAYTQQGTILKDVSQADCQRVIENGDRPFDYFRQQPNQVQNNAQLSNQANNTPTGEYSVLEAAKMEQAKIDGLI
ncbi:zonular occludens toxin domain-containing protein [Acinetobacter sp. YH01003]|uniref:zonular occludens toxin domain-containing protein n=1 Tax=Acinetobacter sp. YH01003 TaxID=2601019 RepID=UPI0015D1B2E6|nr:zonular occludens toxin domain-containing protein [Acinetobacter sp. YH01003]